MPFRITTVSLPTVSGGTVDATFAGLGTPSAAIVQVTRGVTINVSNSHNLRSMGFWDGTNQYCCTVIDENNETTETRCSQHSASGRIAITADSTYANRNEYTISNITDGIRITLSVDNTSNSYQAAVIIFYGMPALAGNLTLGNSSTTITSATHSFVPKITFFMSINSTTVATNQSNFDAIFSFGAGNGTTSNSHLSYYLYTAQATPGQTPVIYCRRPVDNNPGVLVNGYVYTASMMSYGSSTFGLRADGSGNPGDGLQTFWLSLGGVKATMGSMVVPTSGSGSQAVTGVGFRPDLLMFTQTHITSGSVLSGNVRTGGYGMGAASRLGSSTQFGIENRSGYEVLNTDAHSSIYNNRVMSSTIYNSTRTLQPTLTSIDSNGYTLNWPATNFSGGLSHGFHIALADDIKKGSISFNGGFPNIMRGGFSD